MIAGDGQAKPIASLASFTDARRRPGLRALDPLMLMSTSFRSSHGAARAAAAAALAASLSLAGCSNSSSPTSPIDESASPHSQLSAESRLLVGDVLDDAAARLLASTPADSPIGGALTALRSALASGDRAALSAALDATERAVDLARFNDSDPDADRDALALHLLVVRQQLHTLSGAR